MQPDPTPGYCDAKAWNFNLYERKTIQKMSIINMEQIIKLFKHDKLIYDEVFIKWRWLL